MFASEYLLYFGFVLLVAGAVASSLAARSLRAAGYVAVAFTALACAALWTVAARVFAGGDVVVKTGLAFQPLKAALVFHIDKLSAVFVVVLTFVGLAATIYAVEYIRKVYPTSSPSRFYMPALLLIASMVGVVTVSDLFFFFIFWELMTLTSWVLVWFDRENEAKVRAAWFYFVVIHAATGCMLAAALIVYSQSHSFAFADIARATAQMAQSNPALLHVVLGLFFVAFVTKAGMFPLGGWLPEAHPAAPSPASAIFSGAMIKTGIYGVVRFFFAFLGTAGPAATWGGIIASLGAISIFVGTLTALRQDDVKRVLSFHSIGQIGYMLLGVGTSLFFIHTNPYLAIVGLVAGLYHVINHACFKSLLFLNAGSAEYYTGTRDLNLMGGLGKLMPVTMATAVIASLSIAGIPPLNGFASKWLIYQSGLNAGIIAPLFLPLLLAAIFSSIATLASFMKMLGSMFFGHLATNGRDITRDVPAAMNVSQLGLSAACILLGVAPVLPVLLLYGVAREIIGGSLPAFSGIFGSSSSGITLSLGHAVTGVWNPAVIIVALAASGLVAYAISRSARAPARETQPWYCGEEELSAEVRYRAHGFLLPFKAAFAGLYPSIRIPRIPALGRLKTVLDMDNWLYGPLVRAGSRLTDLLARTHSGLPAVYMLWQVIGMALTLLILFILLVR